MMCPSYLGWLWVGAAAGFVIGFFCSECCRRWRDS
jgi:hypothetical protein